MADHSISEPTIGLSVIAYVKQGKPLVLEEEHIVRGRLPFVIWTKETKSTFRMINNVDDQGAISAFYNKRLLESAMICHFNLHEVNTILAFSYTIDWRSTIFRVNNANVPPVYLQKSGYRPFEKSHLWNQLAFTNDEFSRFSRNYGPRTEMPPPRSDVINGIDFIYGTCKLTGQKVMVLLEGMESVPTKHRYDNNPSRVGTKFSHPNMIR